MTPVNGHEVNLPAVPLGRARLGEAAAPTLPVWYSVRKGPQLRGPLMLSKSYDLDRCLTVAREHAPALVIEHDLRDALAVVWRTR